jgi:hypothetical protein
MNFYSYFYVVLVNQDYSLITESDRELLGAIEVFGFLAIVMYFTSHRNWLEQVPSSDLSDSLLQTLKSNLMRYLF